MSLSNNQKKAIGFFILGFIIVCGVYLEIISESQKNFLNFISFIGTYATLYGLVIAYIQIQSIKELNTITIGAVDIALKRINTMITVAEISKATMIIQEIQTSMLALKYELALIRMKDLKAIMIKVKYNYDLNEYTSTQNYHQHITDLSIDMNNLNNHIFGIKKGVNFVKMNENLEKLSTVLNDFENKLKYS